MKLLTFKEKKIISLSPIDLSNYLFVKENLESCGITTFWEEGSLCCEKNSVTMSYKKWVQSNLPILSTEYLEDILLQKTILGICRYKCQDTFDILQITLDQVARKLLAKYPSYDAQTFSEEQFNFAIGEVICEK